VKDSDHLIILLPQVVKGEMVSSSAAFHLVVVHKINAPYETEKKRVYQRKYVDSVCFGWLPYLEK